MTKETCPRCGAPLTKGPIEASTDCVNYELHCPTHGVQFWVSRNFEQRDAMNKKKNPGKAAVPKKKTNGKADSHQVDPAVAREARNDGERAQRFKKLEGLERRAVPKYSAYMDLKEATANAKEEYEAILLEMRSVIRGEDSKPILELSEADETHHV